MDYLDEAFRDLLYLIRRGRRDVLAELLQSTWQFAAMLTALFCVAFYIFYGGDSRQFVFVVLFVLLLPSMTVGVALLDYLMPAHFGRAVTGELLSIRGDFTRSSGRKVVTLRIPELGRSHDFTVRYPSDFEAMIGRKYLVLLHPRLDRHALVLFDDDPNYMESGLDYLTSERRDDLARRAAEFRSALRAAWWRDTSGQD